MKRLLLVMLAFALHCSNSGSENKIKWNDAPPSTQKFKDIQQVSANFSIAKGITDSSGNVYTFRGNRVYKVDTALNATTIAGSGSGTHSDGALLAAGVPTPLFISIDSQQRIHAFYLDRLRILSLVAGTTSTVMLTLPLTASVVGFSADPTGSIDYYTLANDSSIYSLDTSSGVSTAIITGSGDVLGPIATAKFSGPSTIMAVNGGLYVIDFYNKKIKVKDATNVTNYSCRSQTTSQTSSLGTDGPAQSCTYGYITSAFLVNNEIYFIESWSVIRKMNADGSVTTFGKIYDLNSIHPIDNILVTPDKTIYVTQGNSLIRVKTYESN